jgi:hypothetical protein
VREKPKREQEGIYILRYCVSTERSNVRWFSLASVSLKEDVCMTVRQECNGGTVNRFCWGVAAGYRMLLLAGHELPCLLGSG